MYPSLTLFSFFSILVLQLFIIRNQLSQESHYWAKGVHEEVGKQPYFTSSRSIPYGKIQSLPSIRIDGRNRSSSYGGKGDKLHLGGFVQLDVQGLSPGTWTYMLQTIGVKSVIDVGCGRGISSSWFVMHGVDTLCVEGSHDAFEKTILPNPEKYIVEHDYSRGPWWPNKTYDAVWCVEFLEHVGRNLHKNYLPTFRKAAFIFVTHSMWGGWHHVEVHDTSWWIIRFEMYGFVYSPILSERVRRVAKADKQVDTTIKGVANNKYNPQHIWLHMLVFINPEVASLPQHAHLMAENGCYEGRGHDDQNQVFLIHRECGTGKSGEHETKLPNEFKPIIIQEPSKKQLEWEDWVNKHLD